MVNLWAEGNFSTTNFFVVARESEKRTLRQRTFSSQKLGYFLTGDAREDKNVIREHECFERFCPVNFYRYEIKKRGEVGRNKKSDAIRRASV